MLFLFDKPNTQFNLINHQLVYKKDMIIQNNFKIFFQEYLQFRDDRRNLQELILKNCDKIVFPPQVRFYLQFTVLY